MHCQNQVNYNCPVLFRFGPPISPATWTCSAASESSGDSNTNQCNITVTSRFCRRIGIYDENDNLLHTLDPGQVPAIMVPLEEWQDPNPLAEGATRTYIFKEGNFELGRQTASCENSNLEVTSNFPSGCSDAAGVLILTNTGCRDLNIFGTSGNIIGSTSPGGSIRLGPDPKTLYILLAGTDSIGVLFVSGFREIDIDTRGCADEVVCTCLLYTSPSPRDRG